MHGVGALGVDIFLEIKPLTSVWVQSQKHIFCLIFIFSFFLFYLVHAKNTKKPILTSIWSMHHPNAGQNMADAKRTPSYSSDLQFSVIKYIYQADLPKSEICNIGGVQNIQKIRWTEIGPRVVNIKTQKSLTSRPEDCLKTKKQHQTRGSRTKVCPETGKIKLVMIQDPILLLRNVGPMNNRGSFQHGFYSNLGENLHLIVSQTGTWKVRGLKLAVSN